jgi:hypothetical protein
MITFYFAFSNILLLFSCKTEEKDTHFDTITKNYFNDKNALYPLEATQNEQNEYNDQLQFEMTNSFRKSQQAFFNKYESALHKNKYRRTV